MKLFVDSANLADIEEALARGFVRGTTTNPSILAKEERRDYRTHIRDIIDLLVKHGQFLPLSVEVFATQADEMVRQAEGFVEELGDFDGLTVKVPVGWDELRVIAELTDRGIAVNATCAMSVNQAVMALGGRRPIHQPLLGPDQGHRLRPRLGRLPGSPAHEPRRKLVRDHRRLDPAPHGRERGNARRCTHRYRSPQFFPKLCGHPKTDEAVHQFVTEFAAWMG